MPRRAKVSTIEIFRYKFAEVPMPRRAKELAFWFYKEKKFIYRRRACEESVNRGVNHDTRTNSCKLGYVPVGKVVGQCNT